GNSRLLARLARICVYLALVAPADIGMTAARARRCCCGRRGVHTVTDESPGCHLRIRVDAARALGHRAIERDRQLETDVEGCRCVGHVCSCGITSDRGGSCNGLRYLRSSAAWPLQNGSPDDGRSCVFRGALRGTTASGNRARSAEGVRRRVWWLSSV